VDLAQEAHTVLCYKLQHRISKIIGALIKVTILTVLILNLIPFATVNAHCTEGDCVDGHGLMTYEDGSEYSGEWQSGKRTGAGIRLPRLSIVILCLRRHAWLDSG